MRLGILGGVIARPLPAQNLHWGSWLLLPPISRLLAESLSRLDWSGVELGEGILISIPGPTSRSQHVVPHAKFKKVQPKGKISETTEAAVRSRPRDAD